MFFFFQAEDGIRDRNVTGVQTCALPIWDSACGPRSSSARWWPTRGRARRCRSLWRSVRGTPPKRSEERRVGKECRARCSAEQYKKKLKMNEERKDANKQNVMSSEDKVDA